MAGRITPPGHRRCGRVWWRGGDGVSGGRSDFGPVMSRLWPSYRRAWQDPAPMTTKVSGGGWRVPVVWRLLTLLAGVGCAAVGRLRVTGEIPQSLRGTPVVLASNHIGTFDPVALVAAARVRGVAPTMLAAAGLFRVPVVGSVLRACGHIPVDRRSAAVADVLHDAQAALARGAVVALYPEGRIGLDPGMWPERGKTGVARLAMRCGATVVPVAQWGAHEVVAYAGVGAMVWGVLRALARRPVIRVHFGPPVDLSDLPVDGRGSALRATERILDAVTAGLVLVRGDERGVPRFVDMSRPVSTARARRPVGETPARPPR